MTTLVTSFCSRISREFSTTKASSDSKLSEVSESSANKVHNASESSLEATKRKNIPGSTWYHYYDGNWTLLVEDFPALKGLERDSHGFTDKNNLVGLYNIFSLKKLCITSNKDKSYN